MKLGALQPSGRVMTLVLDQGVGPYVPRGATALGIEDYEGHAMAPASQTVPIRAFDTKGGAVVAGVVREAGEVRLRTR